MNALGKKVDEGRDWLRKASVRCQYPLVTGDLRMGQPILYTRMSNEPQPCEVKYLSSTRKRNRNEIPLVVTSEQGRA